MSASTWAIGRSLPKSARFRSLRRSVAGQWPSNFQRRDFHTTVKLFTSAGTPADNPKSNTNGIRDSNITQLDDVGVHGQELSNNGLNNGSGSSKPKDPSNYGSASNRARRNRSPKELPPVLIPDWFLERNVTLYEDLDADTEEVVVPFPPASVIKRMVATYGQSPPPGLSVETTQDHDNVDPSSKPAIKTDAVLPGYLVYARALTTLRDILSLGQGKERIPETSFRRFPKAQSLSSDLCMPPEVEFEVSAMLGAMMMLPPQQYLDIALNANSHMILYCPKNGASRYLIQKVQEMALAYGKFDYLMLNAQDIAEIGGSYMEDPQAFGPGTLSSLGYDISLPAAKRQGQASEQPGQGEEIDEADEEDFREDGKTPSNSQPFSKSTRQRKSTDVSMGIISMGTLVGDFREAFKSLANHDFAVTPTSSQSAPYVTRDSQDFKDNIEDLKMGLLIETLLGAPERKIRAKGYTQSTSRSSSKNDTAESETDDRRLLASDSVLRSISKNFIIFIEDYLQINATVHGSKFLSKLYEVVAAKRSEGKRVMIIGISSSREMMATFSRSEVNDFQAVQSNGSTRTIVVPVTERHNDQVLVREHKNKIRGINLRHLRDMFRRLAPAPKQRSNIVDDWNMEIDSKIAFLVDLDESVWPIERVNRVAIYALGRTVSPEYLKAYHVEEALSGIHNTDQAKYKWVKEQKEDERKANKKLNKRESDAEERIRKLREKCNSHERRLLSGVVDADSIRTTFADIQAPQETIDALKTLTSLSLARPDAFTYGVLATDRIPGLLLYGPPGTGKTLLAKAVAKESASTMLEVSGSDIYNMFVGESEKNVRAIFSLAKKLAPCVIFIDEADAILGSRSGASTRNSHRDLINQFLREWDGMTDSNAFIMVATNRPFDLDEASLRRLPRRLLVDLPVEKDREAILKIHLKEEILDPDVSLSKLASETPFYSGSDLKNLCVAAALACVREEFRTAAEHNKQIIKDNPNAERYKYAEKRTLCVRHFSKGMDEISASISEDMRSLKAIRKFDEKYGDRKGRRKKLGGYGFKTVEESEAKESDATRVRNQ